MHCSRITGTCSEADSVVAPQFWNIFSHETYQGLYIFRKHHKMHSFKAAVGSPSHSRSSIFLPTLNPWNEQASKPITNVNAAFGSVVCIWAESPVYGASCMAL